MTATWTANRTWVAGEIVTASLLNTYVRDNLDWLKTPTDSQAIFSSTFTATSGTAVNVTGASVTITSNGGGFDLFFVASAGCSSIATCTFTLVTDSVTTEATEVVTFAAGEIKIITLFKHVAALTAGSHTFKVQAFTNAGTLSIYGTSTSNYSPVLYVCERGD